MASEQSRQVDSPRFCANGCGFFGSESNLNLCSKCYREFRKAEEEETAKAALEKSLNPNFVRKKHEEEEVNVSASPSNPISEPCSGGTKNRCLSCNKRVGLTGFKCRCGSTFCSSHRYPEEHDCQFDFKAVSRDAIAKANPVVKADKVERF